MSNREGKKVAVIVNDMSEINIDLAKVNSNSNETKLSRVDEKLVDFHNGCICCTLREDLLKEVSAIAQERRLVFLHFKVKKIIRILFFFIKLKKII